MTRVPLSRCLRIIAKGILGFALIAGLCWGALETMIAALPMPDLARADRLSASVLASDGRILKTYLSEDGVWRLRTTADDVPPYYLKMLLAYEDQRFFRHSGVDVLAALRAAYLLIRHGGVVSGASTLTMQTVRLLEKQPRGWWGKVRQVALALKLERKLGKREILSLYLTLVPFGGNIEGVRAASLQYFGVEPRRMSLSQAAMLVAIPQSPEHRKPRANGTAGIEARDWVLRRMEARGVISAASAAAAREEDASSQRGAYGFLAQHLSDRLHAQHPNATAIATFIDRRLQSQLETMSGDFIARQPDPANIAVLVVRRRDMAVIGYVGGAAYYDAHRAGMFDLVRAVRSPGSALKPLIYGLAFEDLIVHPNTIVVDDMARYAGYTPENFDRIYRGELLVRDALIQSVNTVAVMLLDRVGPERFINRMRASGIAVDLPDARVQPGLAVALGGLGINLENLAALYAGIANGGSVQPLRLWNGTRRAANPPLLSRAAAWAVADILADAPPARGRGALRAQDNGRRVAYKTGTSYGYKDAWAVGFDADHVVAVWVGRPDGIGRPGETGALTAVPLMQGIFDLLPRPEHDVAADRPRESILTRTADLPQRLRRYSPRQPLFGGTAISRKLEIRFPANDSTVKLARNGERFAPLALSASGGRPPLRWYVDGHLLDDHVAAGRITWRPEGRGQVEFIVIDADGHKASSSVWLD